MASKEWKIVKKSKTIRFDDNEVVRLNNVLKRIQERPTAKAATFNKAMKELLGLASYGLVTKEDRRELLGKTTETNGDNEREAKQPTTPAGSVKAANRIDKRKVK